MRWLRQHLQAFRVPFDGFAHLATIELVVDAVTATKDFSVFGSRSLEILLTFKWQRYSGRAFVRGLVSYAAYLSLATAYNIEASRTIHHNIAQLGANWQDHCYLFGGWVLTTLVSLTSVAGQLQQMHRTCSRDKGRKVAYKHLDPPPNLDPTPNLDPDPNPDPEPNPNLRRSTTSTCSPSSTTCCSCW